MEEEYGDAFYEKLEQADDFIYDYDGNENELSLSKNIQRNLFFREMQINRKE